MDSEAEITQLRNAISTSQQRLNVLMLQRSNAETKAYGKIVTREFIDTFTPTHDATSCDDAGENNGPSARCDRCALLYALAHNDFSRIKISLTVNLRPKG